MILKKEEALTVIPLEAVLATTSFSEKYEPGRKPAIVGGSPSYEVKTHQIVIQLRVGS